MTAPESLFITLQRRMERGLTRLNDINLVVGLGLKPESDRLAEAIGVPLPSQTLDIRGVGQRLWDLLHKYPGEMQARFALVCAEALLVSMPPALMEHCRAILPYAYGHMSAPLHPLFDLHPLRAKLNEPWEQWLSEGRNQGNVAYETLRDQETCFCGFGLCITAVTEWTSSGSGFLITDPAQLSQYASYADEATFWRVMRRDFIPWLLGGPLP